MSRSRAAKTSCRNPCSRVRTSSGLSPLPPCPLTTPSPAGSSFSHSLRTPPQLIGPYLPPKNAELQVMWVLSGVFLFVFGCKSLHVGPFPQARINITGSASSRGEVLRRWYVWILYLNTWSDRALCQASD